MGGAAVPVRTVAETGGAVCVCAYGALTNTGRRPAGRAGVLDGTGAIGPAAGVGVRARVGGRWATSGLLGAGVGTGAGAGGAATTGTYTGRGGAAGAGA
jgi:hypothetical protein